MPSNTSTTQLPSLSEHSASVVIGAVFSTIAAEWRRIAAAIAVPLTLAFLLSLATLRYYFSTLAVYLTSYDVHTASRAVSVTIIGILLWMLANVIAGGRLMRVLAGERPQAWFDIRPHALDATMNAAMLRYLLVLVVAGALACELAVAGLRLFPRANGGIVVAACAACFLAFAFVFVVRCGLLLPALSYYERRKILRRGWELSQGRVVSLGLVLMLAVVLPAAAVEGVGEIAVQHLLLPGGARIATSLGAAAENIANDGGMLAAIALSLSLSSAVCMTCWTTASTVVYRQLTNRS